MVWDLADWYYDYIFVRRFMSPEPTTSIGSEEGNIVISDTGVGSDALSSLSSYLGVSDSGIGSETIIPTAYLGLNDSGIGTEAFDFHVDVLPLKYNARTYLKHGSDDYELYLMRLNLKYC
jgi:hypothetical protein